MGSLESASNDYGSGSALKISDAELTGFDLKISSENDRGRGGCLKSTKSAGIEQSGCSNDRETMGLS